MLPRSPKLSGLVGSVRVAINQGNLMLGGDVDRATVVRIVLTCAVPYCVSTCASVAAALAAGR